MEFLNLPSAAHMERLTRRVRSVSQRLESIEDSLTRLEDGLRGTPPAIATRLESIEEQLADVTRRLAELQEAQDAPIAVSRDQERLRVEEVARGGAGASPAPPSTSAP
jgi:septal ring factor EnvC (AmiA/AmiB activator)